MDSRESLRALGGSLAGILRGHLTASCYVRGSLPMNPCPAAHAAHGYNLKISTKLTSMHVVET